jgi:hypothetical protein
MDLASKLFKGDRDMGDLHVPVFGLGDRGLQCNQYDCL